MGDFMDEISTVKLKAGAAGTRKREIDIVRMDENSDQFPMAGRRFHFVGAGGIGMSGLAKVLISNGAIVTGSDMNEGPAVDNLRRCGAEIHIGHSQDNLADKTEAVVISAAIKPLNPELKEAQQKGLQIYKYSRMLGAMMDCFRGVAISGTHGKSTTSGWLSFIADRAGLRPNYIVGAEVLQLGSSSGVGKPAPEGLFIAEACEYDRSFLNLNPEIAVILNIEQDHLDYYKHQGEIIDAFADFVSCIKPGGAVIVNGDDPNSMRAIKEADKNGTRIVEFGLDKKNDYYAENIEPCRGSWKFDIYENGQLFGNVSIALPGRHNIYNALAVTAAARQAGMGKDEIITHLGQFTGIDRRLMLKYQTEDITILDDYAHHPTEIRASLEAIKTRYAPERLLCIFQPHQYSRTRFLLDDFAQSFKLCDITVVPEIYFVRDTAESREKVNAEVLVERITEQGSNAVFINSFERIVDYLKQNVRTGDVVVTMGAGDIWKVADEYIRWLRINS
jgi:UDP-N-acetylmuramate--alanine ligase